ncbi:g12569 [Coccomyxa viridis]|uniref:G12569 protein n=1 Tax=Coccomyxa viridis TaxID=1274662 RepID=A0ABP1GAN8_9CHLO
MNRSKSFRISGDAEKPVASQKDWQDRFGADWRWWSALWWTTLIVAAVSPSALASLAKLQNGLRHIDGAANTALEFSMHHPITIPKKANELSDYERIDSSLINWQKGMSSLFKTIEDTTPAGEISDSSLEFKFDADSRKYMRKSFAREVRALAVTVYFGSAALLWAVDSPHLAAVMVHLNVLESVLALKIKALNDSVSKAVQQLQSVQLQFALLPLERDVLKLAQQQLCMQKMELFYESWKEARLGQSMRIPFREDYVALHISLVFSIVLATTLRAVEIALCAFYPNMPRFALLRRAVSWVSATVSNREEPAAGGAAEARRSTELPVQPGWRSWQVLKTSFRQNMILTAPGRHLGSPEGKQQDVTESAPGTPCAPEGVEPEQERQPEGPGVSGNRSTAAEPEAMPLTTEQ